MKAEDSEKAVKLSPPELGAVDEAIMCEESARWFTVDEAFERARQQQDLWRKTKKDRSA